MLITVIVLAVAVVAESGVILRLALSRRAVRAQLTRLRANLANKPSRPSVTQRANRAMRVAVTTASRLRNDGFTGMLSGSLDDLERWAREDRATIARVAAPDGTVTIMFTDIVDSTPRNDELGDERWLRVLAAHERIVRDAVERYGGLVVKNQGDGFMIAFGSPVAAVAAAVDIQRGVTDGGGRVLRQTPIEVRIGLHTGIVVPRDGDFFGRNVAVAARVAGLATAGQIVVTTPVRRALGVGGPDVHPLGRHELKGIIDPVEVAEVVWRPT